MTRFPIDTVTRGGLSPTSHKPRSQGSTIRDRITIGLLYLILLTNVFQYSFWGMQETYYGILRNITIGLVIVLFLVSVRPTQIRQTLASEKFLSFWLFCALFAGVGLLVSYAVGAKLSFGSFRDVVIVLGIVVIGYNIRIDGNILERFIVLYILLGTLSALSYVLVFGFGIHEQYLVDYKNQLAPLFSVLALLAVSHTINSSRYKILMSLCALLLIVVIGILRARTVLIAASSCVMLYLFLSQKISTKVKLLVTGFVIAFIVSNMDLILEIFISGKQGTDLNSISSGRVSRISDGLEFLSKDNNLLTGSLWGEQYDKGIVHVFLLNLWIEYGIILSFPIALFYFVFLGRVISQSFKRGDGFGGRDRVMPIIILLLFIVSFNEYSYPFSPVSSVFLSYLLYGVDLRKRSSIC